MARPKNGANGFTNVPRFENENLRVTIDETVNPPMMMIHHKSSKTGVNIHAYEAESLIKMSKALKALIEKSDADLVKEAVAEIKESVANNKNETVSAAATKASDSKALK